VTIINKKDRRPRAASRKGKLGTRTKFVRQVIREICGFTPFEKRMLEILRIGDSKSTKKAYRFAKVRLGTHKRALRKRAEMEEFIRVEARIQREKEEVERAIRKKKEDAEKKRRKAQEAIESRRRAEAKKDGGETAKPGVGL
jgi:large subunit ribosomal protein L36e